MNRSDFEKAVPPMPNGFYQAMEAALARAGKEERVIHQRRKLRVALIAALVALCLVGTAFAITRGFGVLDFIGDYAGANEVLPQAAELVTLLAQVPEVRTSRVIYRAGEAIAVDGKVSVTIEARPIDADKYMMMDDGGWGDPSVWVGESEKTYEQLAKELGKTLLCLRTTPKSVNGVALPEDGCSTKLDGDTLYLYGELELPPGVGEGPLQLTYEVSDYEVYGAVQVNENTVQTLSGETEEAELAFTVTPGDGILDALSLKGPVRGRDMTVDSATFTRTPFESRIAVTYTVDPAAAQALGEDSIYCSFFWMREKEGLAEMAGDAASAHTAPAGTSERGSTYESRRTWQTIEDLPDVIYLRPYYWDSESWGEVIELTVKEG